MNFDITLIDQKDNYIGYKIEVAKNYEGDKWNATVFQFPTYDEHEDHFFEARGFDTPEELFDYLSDLGNFPMLNPFYNPDYFKGGKD
jgi:hypothetical protein|tara:strand:+ start:475 stop:735 length:261 start_codon:yes stop_codon:yes gene_type:complete